MRPAVKVSHIEAENFLKEFSVNYDGNQKIETGDDTPSMDSREMKHFDAWD